MRILISGGTGFIGSALVGVLRENGHSVNVLSRRADPLPGWDDSVSLVHWNGLSEDIPGQALDGIDAVVNLAGESIAAGRWTEARKDRLFASRIETTRRLVDAVTGRRRKPSVFISASAVGYYGSRGGEEITEAALPGRGFLAVLCSHWEDEARRIVRHGVRLVLLRIGVVLERNGGALPRMMRPFQLFLGGPAGSGHQVLSWIHRDDVIGLIRFALEHEEVSGPINAVAPRPVTNREFARLLGHVLKRPALFPTPAFVLRLALGEMADLVLGGQRVIPRRALEYGYTFRYPELKGALDAILRPRRNQS